MSEADSAGGGTQRGAGRTRLPILAVLTGHVVFTLIHATLFANVLWLMPLLVRLYFGAEDRDIRDWQTTLVTAAIPALLTGSIFWAELLNRIRLRTYLMLFWLVGVLPLGCLAIAQNYWQMLVFHIISAAGFAGWTPVHGRLLKHFYPDAVRGRAFAFVSLARNASSAVAVFFVGSWLEANPDAFRIFFPAAAVALLLALILLYWLARRTHADQLVGSTEPHSWRTLLRPVAHMGEILRRDNVFFRYEAAFMTYGAAFMFCSALLPVLATDALNMRYEDFAHSTEMVHKIAMLALTLPMGWLLDRLGPARTSGIAFGILAVYPLFLLAAETPGDVAFAHVFYGFGLAGVMMGWTLGPVALAPSAEQVPQYSAIHTTLVGIRGILFQGLGMAVYKLTDSFVWPFLAAAVCFAWASLQMWQLQGRLRRRAAGQAARPTAVTAAPAQAVVRDRD